MYPDKKYMNASLKNDLKFVPLPSKITDKFYDTNMTYNFREEKTPENKKIESYGNIRFFNAVQSNSSFDIYIDSTLVKKNLSFSHMTSYTLIPEGTYKIKIYSSESNKQLLIIYDLDIKNGKSYSISIVENYGNNVKLLVLSDCHKNTSKVNVRLINLIPFSPLLNLTINNETQLFSNIEYSESSNYIIIPDGTYSFEIYPSDRSLKNIVVPNIKLESGKCYSLYTIGRPDLTGTLKTLIFKDL